MPLARAGLAGHAGQQRHAGQPEQQAGQRRQAQPGVVEAGVDAEQPQRHGRDEQRGEGEREGRE